MEKIAERGFRLALDTFHSLMGHDATYDSQLRETGKQYLPKFVGVFPSDQIPKLKRGECCIVNLDPTGKPGSHWTGLCKRKKGYIFFDSFGRCHTEIMPSLKGLGQIQNTDNDADQRVEQMDCGQRTLAWLCVYDFMGENYAEQI